MVRGAGLRFRSLERRQRREGENIDGHVATRNNSRTQRCIVDDNAIAAGHFKSNLSSLSEAIPMSRKSAIRFQREKNTAHKESSEPKTPEITPHLSLNCAQKQPKFGSVTRAGNLSTDPSNYILRIILGEGARIVTDGQA